MMNNASLLFPLKYSLLVSCLFLNQQIGLACQYHRGTSTFTFMKAVNKKSVPLLVEVDSSYILKDDFGYSLRLVKVKIINNFSSKYLGQHIEIMDGDLEDCIRDLPSIEKGKRFFINRVVSDINNFLWLDKKH